MRILLTLVAMTLSATAGERFTGWQSCATSGCHGGGKGEDQVLTWRKQDPHSRAYGILIAERSKRMAEILGITDAAKSAQCTVCHSPMESAAPERLVSTLKHPNLGVSCETCHNPAEGWLRFHTRPDITHAQRVAAGMRDLDSMYQRANTCVGCHANLPAELTKAGHPTLRFELARQLTELPPHWQNFRASQSAGAWLTSQATLLRELCWLAEKGNTQIGRMDALQWILRETPLGNDVLPSDRAPRPLRAAADRLAKAASATRWTERNTQALFDRFVGLTPQVRDADAVLAFHRAEVLTPALRATLLGLGPSTVEKGKSALASLELAVRSPAIFDAKQYAELVVGLAKAVGNPNIMKP